MDRSPLPLAHQLVIPEIEGVTRQVLRARYVHGRGTLTVNVNLQVSFQRLMPVRGSAGKDHRLQVFPSLYVQQFNR